MADDDRPRGGLLGDEDHGRGARDRPLVRLLGPIALRDGSGRYVAPARLDRAVLAHLALAEGRAVPVADLVEALWGPAPPNGARNALQVKVSRLRRHLGPLASALQHRQGGYLLDLPAAEVDVRLLARLVPDAAAALAAGRSDAAALLAGRALRLRQGPPLIDLDEHPRLVAARDQVGELQARACEVLAEAALASSGADRTSVIGLLRDLLAEDPLRPRARLLLMRALDRGGRRAEALAVYEEGRRVLAEQTGLSPPAQLQEELGRLLAAERRQARHQHPAVAGHAVPAGVGETARWLARDGARGAALDLALRGCWWWWLGGRRSEGRALLADLLDRSADDGVPSAGVVAATAWLAVFDSVTAAAEEALHAGEDALHAALELGWGRHESVAALLLAERLFQRGEPGRGALLLRSSRAWFVATRDPWGQALADLTAARADLQAGAVTRAAAGARAAGRAFARLGDDAGQMMAADLAGYCAEVVGDLATAARTHERALALARDVAAPEWEATQLTRLGSVQALLGAETSLTTLEAAVRLARSTGSAAGVALAENSLGLARGLSGHHGDAAATHAAALDWYQRQGSRAGVSYTAGRLAVELAAADPAAAARLAETSVATARPTGDPRAVAHALEALAVTHDDPAARARALGGARALRRATRSPLPRLLATPVESAQHHLARRLGADLLPLLREGAREALALAPPRAAS